MSEDALKRHRDAIDAINADLVRLMNERACHAQAIGKIKGAAPVYRPEREAEVLQKVRELNHGPLSDEALLRLMREVMSECLALERPLTVSYLGPEGTFTEEAAVKHFGQAALRMPVATLDEAFARVEAGFADYVVTPVENSTEGAVGHSLDLLLKTPLIACAEVVLRIQHHLLSSHQDRAKIRIIYGHRQALAQCHGWLNRHFPQVERKATFSNAEAARLARNDEQVAAIAGLAAAKAYQLQPLAANIEDEANNTTRFLVLGRQKVAQAALSKTSLAVCAPDEAGAVHHLLWPFAHYGVSMTKFESRPARTGLWKYVFFIDIAGHMDDDQVALALVELAKRAAWVKVIGSYPQAFNFGENED